MVTNEGRLDIQAPNVESKIRWVRMLRSLTSEFGAQLSEDA